jgi:hypothetical protein
VLFATNYFLRLLIELFLLKLVPPLLLLWVLLAVLWKELLRHKCSLLHLLFLLLLLLLLLLTLLLLILILLLLWMVRLLLLLLLWMLALHMPPLLSVVL